MPTPNAEFLLDFSKVPGFVTPRLYVPRHLSQLSDFRSWCDSVCVIHSRSYSTGNVIIWFFAPLDEYFRLASIFPHSEPYHRKRTNYILSLFSTQQSPLNYWYNTIFVLRISRNYPSILYLFP